MGEVKWYRVTDPLNPLYGCDVRGREWTQDGGGYIGYLIVEAMRRVDIFVGDRPFQLIAPPGEDLGINVRTSHLSDSPLQDDVVELTTDQPYGECLDEYEVERGDGLRLHIAMFEHAVQVALLREGKLLRSQTHGSLQLPDEVRQMFEDGSSADDILERMAVWDGEEDQ